MSDADLIVELMSRFSFDATAALAYAVLLSQSPLSIEELSRNTNQPVGAVRTAVRRLQRWRLLARDHERGKPKYYATDPSLAWVALVADLVWSAKTDLSPIRELAPTNNPAIEKLRAVGREIMDMAQSMYQAHRATLAHRELDAETTEELAQLACEVISLARKEILAVSKSPRLPQVSSFWAVLTGRIESGATYHRVVDLQEVIDHGLKIVSRDMEAYGIDLRVIEQDKLRRSFYLVDHKYLVVFHTAQRRSEEADRVGRITNQAQILDRYRKRFNEYDKTAIPGKFVVSRMRLAAGKLLERAHRSLPSIEALWLEDLIEYGKFSKFHVGENWSAQRLAQAEARATTLGLIQRNSDGEIVPVYPTNVNIIWDEWSQITSHGSEN